jgi:very-short-patch-repair endonuclease
VRCIHAGLPAPAVNVDAYDARGRFLGKPDLSFPKYRVAVDYEGEVHRIDAVQWAKDLKRAPRFEDAGWSYLRAGAADYRDSHELIARIRSRLRQHGWRP